MNNKRNQFAIATLASAIVASVVVQAPVEAATVFPDVKQDSTHYGPIHALANEGIVSGFPDGLYHPNESVTRGQAAKILAGVLGLDTTNVKNPGFNDISTSHQYYGAIAALAEQGIISGFEDKTYRPAATITRGHMAKIIVEGMELKTTGDGSNFVDVPANHQYKAYVDALFTNGITKGQPNGSNQYGVANPVTRGQIATFIARAKEAIAQPDTFDVTILHQNDIHANLDNIAKTVTAVKEERKKDSDALLLNAGDVFSGTLYFNEYQGMADLEFLNMMGVDAFVFGNHEFDLGSTPDKHLGLSKFVKGASFPFVAANVDFSKDANLQDLQSRTIAASAQKGKIYDGIIKTIDGEKVGIFGLTTAETKSISSPGSVEFENYLTQAEKSVESFEQAGVDKIIALTHIGYDDNPNVDNDLQLAARIDGIDVIVGGHSHTQLTQPTIVNKDDKGAAKDPTVIVQAYQYNDFLGKLNVSFDEHGVVKAYDGELLKIADYTEDPAAAVKLKTYKERIQEIQQQELGATATAPLINPRASDEGNTTGVSVRNSETALGNLITQGMLTKAKLFAPNVIMALQNGGGIRQPINQGPITVGEVINVLPFGNTLATMQITGAELKAAFEHSFKEYPKESGGFLHVAGGRITLDSTKAAGSRITKIEYNNNGTWTEINAATTYTIATNAFTAKGGDGYDMFAKAYAEGRVTDLGLSDWENLADYLATLKTVTPTLTNTFIDTLGQGGGTTPPIVVPPSTITLDAAQLEGTNKEFNRDVIVRDTGENLANITNVKTTGNLTIQTTTTAPIELSYTTVAGNLILSDVLGGVTLNNVSVAGNTIK